MTVEEIIAAVRFKENFRKGFCVVVPTDSFPKVFMHYGQAFGHTNGFNTRQLRNEVRSWLALKLWHIGDRIGRDGNSRSKATDGQEIWFAHEQVAVEFKLTWL